MDQMRTRLAVVILVLTLFALVAVPVLAIALAPHAALASAHPNFVCGGVPVPC